MADDEYDFRKSRADLAALVARRLANTFRIERELPPGGQARVFIALEIALDRRVVIKVFGGESVAEASVRRFVQEIALVATLQHPNIVPILSSGDIDGHPFYVMPFISGDSLRAHMRNAGALPVREVTRILRDVARALAFAHAHGVIHRDIKPDNVLLAEGVAVVTDFGIAKATSTTHTRSGTTGRALTMTGEGVGTPAYMAPEQIAFDPAIDHRADIYAFGILGYEMLSGGPLFGSRTPQSVVAAHLVERPEHIHVKRPDVPAALAHLLGQCLEKDRELRPASASRILESLDDSMVSSEQPPVLDGGAPPPPRRRLGVRAIGAVSAVVIAIFAIVRGTLNRATSEHAPMEAAGNTVLVLPFVAIGGDSTAAIAGEGVSSELIATLTKRADLRIVEQPSDPAVRQRFAATPALAVAMRATTLIEGTIQRSGSRLRISARLVDAASGYVRWAATLDHATADLFGAQDELVRAVSVALRATHPGVPSPVAVPPISRGTANSDAYDAYVRARFFFQQRGRDPLHRAHELLGHAIALDSGFARAFALRAQVEAVSPIYSTSPPEATRRAGIIDASRAIALDSTLADGWTARASLRASAFEWDAAEADFRHALVLAPQNPLVHQWLGEELLILGRARESVNELSRAADLDPLSPILRGSLAVATSIAGDRAAAISLATHAVELDTALFATQLMLGTVLVYDGRLAAAIPHLEYADRGAPGTPVVLGMLGYVEAQSGSAERAGAVLARLRAIDTGDADFAEAHIFIALHRPSEALSALERAVDRRAQQLAVESQYSPIFDSVRDDPRFRALMRRLGLGTQIRRD